MELSEIIRGLSDRSLNRLCDEAVLNKVATEIGTDWHRLVPELKLKAQDEQAVQIKHPHNLYCQSRELLQRWKEAQGNNETYRFLVAALNAIKRNDIACAVADYLRLQLSSLPPIPEDIVGSYRKEILHLYKKPLRSVQFPSPPTRKWFNLAIAQLQSSRYGLKDYEELTQLYLQGSVDDIMKKRIEVTLDSLFPGSNEPQEILVEGAPGAGKSTLAWHACQEWREGKLFQQFKLVIFIQLRDPAVHKAESLDQILPHNIRETEKEQRALQSIQGEHVLFVMDSWDEFMPKSLESHVITKLIERPEDLHLAKRSLLITSRPIACGNIYDNTDMHLEIVGFRKTEVRAYFREVLKNDKQKMKTLEEEFKRCPTVETSCYLPLNATFVAHIFLAENALPESMHAVFEKMVILLLKRHEERLRHTTVHIPPDTSLSKLPEALSEPGIQLKNISKLAYLNVKQNKATFPQSALEELGICKGNHFGLLQAVETSLLYENVLLYNFLHISIQELLAALHISKFEDEDEQTQVIMKLSDNPRFRNVFQFYAGLTGLKTKGMPNVIKDIAATGDKQKLRTILQCLLEAKDPNLYKFLAAHLRDGKLDLSKTSLSPVECIALSYFLAKHAAIDDPDRPSLSLDLRQSLFQVSHLICKLGERGCCFESLDLSNVDFSCSMDDLNMLLRKCQSVRVLKLNNCSLSSEGGALQDLILRGTEEMDLSNNQLMEVDFLKCGEYHKLQIDLSNNPLLTEGSTLIQSLIRATTTFLTIIRMNKCFGEGSVQGLEVLKIVLTENNSLEELELAGNYITITTEQLLKPRIKPRYPKTPDTEDDIQPTAVSCQCSECQAQLWTPNLKSRCLRVLDLSDNIISVGGTTAISHFLEETNTLKVLRMNHCFIGQAGMKALGNVLREGKNVTLEELELHDNLTPHLGFHHSCRLKKLDFCHTHKPIGTRNSATDIIDFLKRNTSLEHVRLHVHHSCEEDFLSLSSPSLELLELQTEDENRPTVHHSNGRMRAQFIETSCTLHCRARTTYHIRPQY